MGLRSDSWQFFSTEMPGDWLLSDSFSHSVALERRGESPTRLSSRSSWLSQCIHSKPAQPLGQPTFRKAFFIDFSVFLPTVCPAMHPIGSAVLEPEEEKENVSPNHWNCTAMSHECNFHRLVVENSHLEKGIITENSHPGEDINTESCSLFL